MSLETLLPAQLLICNDDDFNSHIKNMPAKCLMEVIAVLQQEMESEQERFNNLSTSLHGLRDRNSRQYKTISNDMTASQVRLTTLMNRSMQCFSQNLQKNKQDVQLHTKNAGNHAGLQNPSSTKPTYQQCIGDINGILENSAASKTSSLNVRPQTSSVGSTVPVQSKQNKSQVVISSSPSSVSIPGKASLGEQKIFQGLPSVRQLAQAFGGKSEKFPGQASAVVASHIGREVSDLKTNRAAYPSMSLTNLDRKKSSSTIALTFKPGDQDTSLSASSVKTNQMLFGGMRRAQSREQLHSVDSKAYVQKDALIQEIHLKRLKVDTGSGLDRDTFAGDRSSGVTGKESSVSRQKLQQGKD